MSLRLYREILRLHKALPPVMRQLGDRVLRDEWRAMAAAERKGKATDTQWREFDGAWRRYADTLVTAPQQSAAPAEVGELLEDTLTLQLTPEQRVQLNRLRDEARKQRGQPETDG
jgi:hypothetical protein